jgi:hypothetical protein
VLQKPLVPPFTLLNTVDSGTTPSTGKAAIPASIAMEQKLSTFYLDESNQIRKPSDDISGYLHSELNVRRLNDVDSYLWLAGRPIAARPLHRQKMIGREIILTEQTDLHLVWFRSTIFIKPLPNFLLSYVFWKDHICTSRALYEDACGLLLSYIWLIQHESDLNMATGLGMLPKAVDWSLWVALADQVLAHIDPNSLDQVNRRYHYGELRLFRLNMIYRLNPAFRLRFAVRGYLTKYHTYHSFFKKNFAWLLVVFAYSSIVLNAMQVGLGSHRLADDLRFQKACYGMAVFSIIAPVILVGIMIALYIFLFLFNYVMTIQFLSKQKKGEYSSKN